MKHSSVIGRLTGRVSIPVFAGITAGLFSILLYLAVMAISIGYRMIVLGAPFGFVVPLPVLLVMLVACLTISGLGTYLCAKPLQAVFERFTAYMMTSRVDAEAELENMQFPELRRLRAATTQTVRKLRRENETLRQIAYKDSRTGLPNAIALERHVNATLPEASFEYPAAFMLLDIDRFGQLLE
uniref:GGDEF domain-containing protein n=1 Tax=Hyphomonas sp. TaxID=87 RepID=UPI0037BF5B51